MTRLNENNVFSIVIFLFGLLIFVSTLGFRGDVALVPKIVSGCLLFFSGIQLVTMLLPRIPIKRTFMLQIEREASALSESGAAREEKLVETQENVKKRYFFIGWMLLFTILIYFSSMIWGILISMFLYLKWISKESWKMSIIYSSTVTLFIYVVFVVGFKIHYFL
ncbi:tripartite tricarboxylate transporter TctB family protein [Bacillus canaveralius]|uniref:tripartite tricarboxylate transporter TctB family protein n=1 Tax=Bacillus canaveralius TaxID=1403243 RepID=UPI000F796A8E|nr:tripartite tricarboxylate transporter TctB family protein [Bacillus canaveralius]RSK49213.1 hypothetical protein EJA13_15875 [Bacillus canaveralius]